MSTDRIEKKVLLRAPRQLVWRALTDYQAFEKWFGVKFDVPFRPGASMSGKITGTTLDAEIAKSQKQYEDLKFEITIDRIEPQRLFSFRWHPSAIERAVDYSQEATTLVVFTLEEAPGGTLLTVSESGFDQIPLARRAEAFKNNQQGWEVVTRLIEKYLARV